MPSDSMDQVHDTRTMCCHDHLPRDHDHKLIHPCHNNKDFHRNSFRLNVILLLILTINCVFLPQESDGSLRHHRDHVRNFSCGKLFYRTLSVSKDVMFVGAMDRIFRIPMANINRTRCEIDSLPIGPDNGEHCVSKGKSGHYECRNHVRVIQVIDHGSKLYVCGTNAHSPKDWILDSNSLQMLDPSNFPGIGNGIAKCPFDPEDNSTAVWVERGNPEGAPGLYSGSVAEFTKADTVIFRSDLYNMTTGQKVHPFKRTVKYDSKWLDKPNFVGSFEVGEYVYFFFRESAVEFINCGKNIYSRVARVCKRDMGGKNILSKNWASFLKARLNCSIPGEFPFYFNEIQHVFRHPDSQRSDSGYGFDGDSDNPNAAKFYAVFSTSSNGLTGSAICSFSLDSITEVFNGKFKEQATSSSAWLPVLNSKVPEPRPGVCMNDTQSLPDSVLNFIRAHPLMDSAVPHDNSRPIFFKRDVIFTKIVVDFRTIENPFGGGDPLEYTIYYAGTSTGLVYKIVEWKNNHNHPPLHHPHNHNPSSSSSSSSSSYNYNHQYYRSAQSDQAAPDTSSSSSSGGSEGSPLPSTSNSHLVDIFDATSPEPIRAMELSSKYKSLYVASDSHIRQFDLYTCKTRYETCMRCSRDPYCGWDKNHGECKPYSKGWVVLLLFCHSSRATFLPSLLSP